MSIVSCIDIVYLLFPKWKPFFFPSFGLVYSIWICYLFLIHINRNLSLRLSDTCKTDALGEEKWFGISRGWNKWRDGWLKLYPILQITLCDSGRMEALLSNLVAQQVWKRLRWCSECGTTVLLHFSVRWKLECLLICWIVEFFWFSFLGQLWL